MDHQVPPPPSPLCLERRDPSSQKGGTLIAGDVTDRASHEDRLCDGDSYRPAECLRCHCCVLHVHDYPWRVTRADPDAPGVRIIRFICAMCEATWRIVPGFLVRHLWRTWKTVETALGMRARTRDQPPVPKRTVRRWRSRLHSAAGEMGKALSSSEDAEVVKAVRRAGPAATRLDVVVALGTGLAVVAALLHRVAAGVRVM